MNKLFRLAVCALLMAVAVPFASAKKQKTAKLYDSKSWIVPVVSDRFALIDGAEISTKAFKITAPVPDLKGDGTWSMATEKLNAMDYGNKVIDLLTKDGTSEELLREIALLNMQKQDEEFASETMRVGSGDAVTNVVAEDYLPILTHCYVIMNHDYTVTEKNKKTGLEETKHYVTAALFRVVINNEQAFDIMSCIGDPTRYAALPKFKMELAYITKGSSEDIKELPKEVPDLALRGVITRRHPAQISIGENAGLKKGDLVSIFSQRMDKNGNMYSKRISRARVCKAWDDHAQINFEANTAGNRKNGDVVVRTPDNHLRMSLMATYSPHVWGGEVLFDFKSGYTRSGIIHHFLLPIDFAMTDHPGDKFTVLDDPTYEYNAPIFLGLGMGYGLSKTFLGFFDLMPYFTVNYEGALMFGSESKAPQEWGAPESEGHLPFGSYIRVPVGLRFSFNIGYPLRLALEAGYAFNFGVGGDTKIIEQTCDYMGAKRKGAFVKLGLIF